MQLCLLMDVERVMRTKRFEVAQKERADRSAGARKALSTERQNTAGFVDAMMGCIQVGRKGILSKVFGATFFTGISWKKNQGFARRGICAAGRQLQHQAKVGVAEECPRYKEAVLEAIKRTCSEFADECERQKACAHDEFVLSTLRAH